MLIHPPDYPAISGPLVFLAGPIQGAPDWQAAAVRLLTTELPELDIANPRRDSFEGEFVFDQQVDWETHHLRRAGAEGVILFWLASEAEHDCSRCYAQTSRFELGEWKLRHERDRVQLVVGIDSGFAGAKYIRRRLARDCPNMPVCSTLEETCRRAAEVCRNSANFPSVPRPSPICGG